MQNALKIVAKGGQEGSKRDHGFTPSGLEIPGDLHVARSEFVHSKRAPKGSMGALGSPKEAKRERKGRTREPKGGGVKLRSLKE